MILIIWANLFSSGFNELPNEKKVKQLSVYFSPNPEENLHIPKREVTKHINGDLLKARGFIKITPPENSCFRIRKPLKKKEHLICKEKIVSFSLASLDEQGQLVWEVYLDNSIFPTRMVWKTGYRFAQVVGAGYLNQNMGKFFPIKNCTATKEKGRDYVFVELFDKTIINLRFSKNDPSIEDLWMKKEKKRIRLLKEQEELKKAQEAQEGTTTSSDESSVTKNTASTAPSKEQPKQKEKEKSLVGMINAGIKKIVDKPKYSWVLVSKSAKIMNSANLYVDHVSNFNVGECRYLYKNAPSSPEDGAVECTLTGDYDAIYMTLSCTKELLD